MPSLLLTAAWIFPVEEPPLRNGAILIQDGLVKRVFDEASLAVAVARAEGESATWQMQHCSGKNGEDCAILPGLVNLHTHLDYTNMAHLSDFDGETMFDWLEDLVEGSRSTLNGPAALAESAFNGAKLAALSGTTFVVDSTFSGAAAGALARIGLRGLVGLELFGLDESKADFLFQLWQSRLGALTGADTTGGDECLTEALTSGRIRLTIAPHAPYTVAPALWKKASAWARERNLPLTCHLAESQNEHDWIASFDERLHDYLLQVMPKNPDPAFDLAAMLKNLPWRGRGLSPVEHLAREGLLDERTIAAHCLKISSHDAEQLAKNKVKVALCPRSNAILKNGRANPRLLMDKAVTFGLGTDSRASAPSLDIKEEAGRLKSENPTLTGEQILRFLTIDGARAVGLDETIGSLTPGKSADLAVFALSPTKNDLSTAEGALAAIFAASQTCLSLFVGGQPVVSEGCLI